MRFCLSVTVAFLAASLLTGSLSLAKEGEKKDPEQPSAIELLTRATVAKLNANSLADLGEVIRLLEEALQQGLDESGTQFAQQLLAATRIQRGRVVAQAVFSTIPPDPNWREFRRVALDDLEKGVAVFSDEPQALLAIAQLNLLPGGDSQRVATALDAAVRAAEREPLLKAKALLLRAELTEDPQKRLADLNEAVRAAPGSAATYRARGAWYHSQGKLEEALADFNAALGLEAGNATVLAARGAVLSDLKRYEEAIADFTKAHELEPKAVLPLFQLGRLFAVQGKFQEALEALDKAYAADPGNVAVLLLRGTVYQQLNEPEKALADADRALKLRPGLPAAMQLRAAVLAGSNKFEEAIAQLEELQQVVPEDPDVDLQLAMFYNVEGRPRKAIELFSKVLAAKPDNFVALRGRADALLSVGRQAEAIADYQRALKLRPDDPGVLNNLAWVLATSPDEKLRDGKRAIELATKACELTDYKQAHILSTLAAAYAETGDFPTAIKWSQRAVELGSEDQKEALAKELASYKAGKPVRELQNVPEAEPPQLPGLETAEKPAPAQTPASEPGQAQTAPAEEKGPALVPPQPAKPEP